MTTSNNTENGESAPNPMSTVGDRLGRVKAVVTALQCITAAGDDCLGSMGAEACTFLAVMADEEMKRVKTALGDEVMSRLS
jgi:hypothetical protein